MWSTGNAKRRLPAASEEATKVVHAPKRQPGSTGTEDANSEKKMPAAAEAAASKTKPRTKIAATADLAEATSAIAKLTLQNTALIRELRGTVWTTFILPATHPAAAAGLVAGRNYDADVRAAGKQHTLGAPHLHVAAAFFDAAATHAEEAGASVNPNVRTYLRDFWAQFKEKSKEEWARVITYFRVRKVQWREEGDDKVILSYHIGGVASWSQKELASLDGVSLATALREFLLSTGGEEKSGAPPRGATERKAQAVLQDLAKLSK